MFLLHVMPSFTAAKREHCGSLCIYVEACKKNNIKYTFSILKCVVLKCFLCKNNVQTNKTPLGSHSDVNGIAVDNNALTNSKGFTNIAIICHTPT